MKEPISLWTSGDDPPEFTSMLDVEPEVFGLKMLILGASSLAYGLRRLGILVRPWGLGPMGCSVLSDGSAS